MPHTFPRDPVPKNRAQVYLNILKIPQLEIPQFDSLSLRNELSEFLGDSRLFDGESKVDPSSLGLSGCFERCTDIRDVGPEWDSGQDDSSGYPMENPVSRMSLPFSSEVTWQNRLIEFPCPPPPCPGTRRLSDQKGLSLEDFSVNLTLPDNQTGTCIRRSDGRIYAIKKVLQTRQTLTELAILERVKHIRNSFCPLLHWTFEKGHHIYFIMDNYPNGTLTDAIGRYGMFGPLEAFFYACEIIMGLRFLHDAGIVHRNVSPETITFDRQGHIILSGIENGAILQPRGKEYQDIQGSKHQYQAPEILLGWKHNFLVDSWSFGMVLYYMFHGKHAFMFDPDREIDFEQIQKLVGEGVSSRAVRFISPIARDLIFKCIERNPAMRAGVREIQHHPYFSNADWRNVLEKKTLAPLPRGFRVSTAIQSSGSPCRVSPSPEQYFPPRVSAFGFGNRQRSISQVMPQSPSSPCVTPEMRDRIGRSLYRPVAQSAVFSDPASCVHGPDSIQGESRGDRDDSDATEFRTDETEALSCAHAPPTDIWEILDREERLSLHSDYSTKSVMKMSSSHLRKERSSIYRQKLFNLSTVSIPQKLRRKPKSVTALKCASYAEPITDLPRGLNQMGSGIGFTYTAPKTPIALKTSVGAEYDLALGTKTSIGASRASVSSDFTVAVPKACQGLIHSLSMSSLWTGLKSHGGSMVLPATTVSPEVKEATNVLNSASESFSATDGYFLSKKGELAEELQSGLIHPLAESTAIVSPSPGMRSPSGTLSITSSTASEEGILTPDTLEFPQPDVVFDMGPERSEKLFGLFEPESTLRLVTPWKPLSLAFGSP